MSGGFEMPKTLQSVSSLMLVVWGVKKVKQEGEEGVRNLFFSLKWRA